MNKLKSMFHKNKKHPDQNTDNSNTDNNNNTIGDTMTAEQESHETRRQLEQLSLSEDVVDGGAEFNESVSSFSSSGESSLSSSSFTSSNQRDESNGTKDQQHHHHQRHHAMMDIPMFTEQNELTGYQLLAKIGEGAFSKVFKGVNLQTGEEYAVKVIKKQTLTMTQEDKHTKSTTKLEQVLKEVTLHKMITSYQCPNIVKFIEFKETSSFYYIVQELLTGGEIFNSIVKYTYFSEDLSRHVIKQLGNAVRVLHSIGIVHRDIKPENLLFEPIEYIASDVPRLRKSDDPMTKQDEGLFQPNVGGGGIGLVKLTDFGLSKQINQTNTKTPCGTVGYTAPEVVKDEKYSMEVDMWGVGCVLYTMLCGFPPFYDEKIDILTEKISRGEYTFLEPWWDEISVGAKRCVERLLEVDPEKRYSVDEFLNDPWLNAYDSEPVIKREYKRHHLKHHQYHNDVDPSLLYSPAAVAMRDAFDVSNAVKRNQLGGVNNNNINNNHNNNRNKRKGLYSLDEEIKEENEDEDDEVGSENYVDDRNEFNNEINEHGYNLFELNMKTSTIIQRRQKKQRMTSPLAAGSIPISLN